MIYRQANHDTDGKNQPTILRKPEIIHGLRNLIQNGVDFAESQVWVETGWSDQTISVRIMDDGPGFPVHMLGRIGDPFVRQRKTGQAADSRPEYEGMGLGLFIAKTLLERSGAHLRFANAPEGQENGAVVEVIWPRNSIATEPQELSVPLGKNQHIKI